MLAPVANGAQLPKKRIVYQVADGVHLGMLLHEKALSRNRKVVTAALLGTTAIPKLPYADFDGKPMRIDTDYFGNKRNLKDPFAGSFENPGI